MKAIPFKVVYQTDPEDTYKGAEKITGATVALMTSAENPTQEEADKLGGFWIMAENKDEETVLKMLDNNKYFSVSPDKNAEEANESPSFDGSEKVLILWKGQWKGEEWDAIRKTPLPTAGDIISIDKLRNNKK